jgi:hypothetical protein
VMFGAALHAAEMLATAWNPHLHSLTEVHGHSSPGLSTSQSGSLESRMHPTPDGFNGQAHGSNSSENEAQMHFTHGTCGAVGHVLEGVGVVGGAGVITAIDVVFGAIDVTFGAVEVVFSATDVVFGAALHAADMFATASRSHLHSAKGSQSHSPSGLSMPQSGSLEPILHPVAGGSAGQSHGSNSSEPRSQRHFTQGTCGTVGHVLGGVGVGVGAGVMDGVVTTTAVVFGAALHAADMFATA